MEKKKENTAGGSDWPRAREHRIILQGAVLSSEGGWRPARLCILPCASATPSGASLVLINCEVE